MEKDMKTLYLIRGIPGCGKSTLAKELLDKNVVQYIFEADQYFVDSTGNYVFDAVKLKFAHEHCQANTTSKLSEGFSVAVSNTSTTEREVATYQKIAEQCGATFISIIVENRHGSTNVHSVPEDTIINMRHRFSVKL